jgi:hypothetical protein
MRRFHIWLVLLLTASGWASAQHPLSSEVRFTSTNASLQRSFDWAKQQALEYTRSGTGTMGPWYEAALPGRNAFCMRDVSHQTEGAAALGLYSANRNMLGLFAGSAAKERDWAAYWEIDGDGHPSSADYVSDTDFWFNLPANFDLLDASVRMWRWIGDNSYRDDPIFRRFYQITMTSYIEAWQLKPDDMLSRPRIANQHRSTGRFVHARGIPSYTEGSEDFIFGTDLLAAEYRGIRSFGDIATSEQDLALAHQLIATADRIQDLLERIGWSKEQKHYLGTIHKDLTGSGSGDTLILYFGAAKDPEHLRGALTYISSPEYWQHINIEEESYLPLTLFRYGRNVAAYRILADLSDSRKHRREYPEVSYAVIAGIVSGVMGLEPASPADTFDVRTVSRLTGEHDRAMLQAVSIKANHLNVTHLGTTSTRLTNVSGPQVRWRAAFPGTVSHLHVNGSTVKAQHSTLRGDMQISWIDVAVPPGSSRAVSR